MVFHPLVQIILPGKLIGFGRTLLIQGYLCIYLALTLCTTNVQRGIAGIMAAALVSANYTQRWGSAFWSGPTMTLIIGAVLFFILEYEKKEHLTGGPVGSLNFNKNISGDNLPPETWIYFNF